MNIDTIIVGCKRNDRRCQEALYRSQFPILMSMCMRYTSDKEKAASIINEGMFKVFTRIDQYEHKGSFEGWIRRIVFRCLSDAVRKDSNYVKFMVFEDQEQSSIPLALNHLYEEDIIKLIKKIPNASGEVFTMYAIQGYTHREIAEVKGISVGTSKWHLSEARKRLQQLILDADKNRNAG